MLVHFARMIVSPAEKDGLPQYRRLQVGVVFVQSVELCDGRHGFLEV